MRRLTIASLGLVCFAALAQGQDIQSNWSKSFGGSSNHTDYVNGLTIDAAGNVYVAGPMYETGKGYDFGVASYDITGKLRWSQTWDSPTHVDDVPVGIAVDSSGNCYVAGRTYLSSTNVALSIIKLNGSGVIWAKTYQYNSKTTYPTSMTLNPSQEVIVAGNVGTGTGQDMFAMDWTQAGGVRWVQTYDLANNVDAANAVCCDNFDNVYLAGSATNILGNFATIVELDYNGKFLANHFYTGAKQKASFYAITMDWNGDPVACGAEWMANGYSDVLVAGAPKSGSDWHTTINGDDNLDDAGYAIACTRFSNEIWVTGYSNSSIGSPSPVRCTYTVEVMGDHSTGIKWLDGSFHGGSSGYGIVVDKFDRVHVAGDGVDSTGKDRGYVFTYNDPGDPYISPVGFTAPGNAKLSRIATDSMGHVWAGGWMVPQGATKSDFLTVQDVEHTVGINDAYGFDQGSGNHSFSGSLSVIENDHYTTSAKLVSGPSHGTAFTFNTDGSWSYTPDPTFVGTDKFYYDAYGPGGPFQDTEVDIEVGSFPKVKALSVLPGEIAAGDTAIGTVSLESTNQFTPKVVWVEVVGANNVTVPANVTIPIGKSFAKFNITTAGVVSTQNATINAGLDGSDFSASLKVDVPALASLVLSKASVTGGTGLSGTVNLDGLAPVAGDTVAISTNTPSLVTVPVNVVVPHDKKSISFMISTNAVSANKTVTVSASYKGVTKTMNLTLTP